MRELNKIHRSNLAWVSKDNRRLDLEMLIGICGGEHIAH